MPIPVEVVRFMEDVLYRIEWHDETVEKESDDSIQDPGIAPMIGGVMDAKAKYFSFHYTASKAPRISWHFALFDNEIEDIAKGRVMSLSLWKCTKASCRDLFSNKGDVYCNCSRGFAHRSIARNRAANNRGGRTNSQQPKGSPSADQPSADG